MATRLPNDDTSGGVYQYVIKIDRSSVNGIKSCSEKRNEDDVTENEIRPRQSSSCNAASPLNESPSEKENEYDVTVELDDEEIVPNRGADITVPGVSENGKNC